MKMGASALAGNALDPLINPFSTSFVLGENGCPCDSGECVSKRSCMPVNPNNWKTVQ